MSRSARYWSSQEEKSGPTVLQVMTTVLVKLQFFRDVTQCQPVAVTDISKDCSACTLLDSEDEDTTYRPSSMLFTRSLWKTWNRQQQPCLCSPWNERRILCVLDRASSWYLNKGRPTWCHLLYYVNLLLNMFRMLIHPSLGACDNLVCYCVGCIVLTWGVLVLCCGIGCWWCGIRVQAEPLVSTIQPTQ